MNDNKPEVENLNKRTDLSRESLSIPLPSSTWLSTAVKSKLDSLKDNLWESCARPTRKLLKEISTLRTSSMMRLCS